jgi:hypothetical protein
VGYDARAGDAAVRAGARLFESPALPDHPDLAAYAIVRPSQLDPDPGTPRYAEQWVVDLEPAQVESYGVLLDAIIGTARRHGHRAEDVACEVLSTANAARARAGCARSRPVPCHAEGGVVRPGDVLVRERPA